MLRLGHETDEQQGTVKAKELWQAYQKGREETTNLGPYLRPACHTWRGPQQYPKCDCVYLRESDMETPAVHSNGGGGTGGRLKPCGKPGAKYPLSCAATQLFIKCCALQVRLPALPRCSCPLPCWPAAPRRLLLAVQSEGGHADVRMPPCPCLLCPCTPSSQS